MYGVTGYAHVYKCNDREKVRPCVRACVCVGEWGIACRFYVNTIDD
jgi:hypothetical protein